MENQIIICQLLSEHEIRTRGVVYLIQIFHAQALKVESSVV
jgi:hypothetical protein